MIKVVALTVLLSLAVRIDAGEAGYSEVGKVCEQIAARLDVIQQQMKKETDRIDAILVEGHINIKDPFTAKAEEITEINKRIEKLAKELQKIYDDKDYLQYCILLQEEKQYKEHNTTELTDAHSKLKAIVGSNEEEL